MPVAADVVLGKGVTITHPDLVNLYGCVVGDDTMIGPFVEIQKNVTIGNRCKISSHSFICSGVTIGDEVFVGHGVIFINDRLPRAAVNNRRLVEGEWALEPISIGNRTAIGSGAIIMCGVTIGHDVTIGAGAVVVHDVADQETVAGVPARTLARIGVTP